jgi:regulator of sigma E protease
MVWNLVQSFNVLGNVVTGWVIPILFLFTLVVFIHEFGHFIVARWCGIKVLVFSIGFGPELIGFDDRHGTRWKFAAIPLGGYVKFFGDENAASVPDAGAVASMTQDERRVSFFHQPVWARAAVVAAGPLANFILAIVIFTALFMFYGKQETAARVDEVIPNSAAAAAGFRPGDLVVAINGKEIESFNDMKEIVALSAGETLKVTVERGGAHIDLQATPTLTEEKDIFGNVHRVGQLGIKQSIAPQDIKTRKYGPVAAFGLALHQTWSVVDQTFSYLGKLAVGHASPDQLGGPIRIAQMSAQMATLGFATFMSWTGLISVSIGLLNLFPIPLLDGGHLLFYGIEASRGRPLSERAQEVGFRIGFAILLMLMIFATVNDYLRTWAS